MVEIELDYMEYANDGLAQAAYVSSNLEAVDQGFETGGDNVGGLGNDGARDLWRAMKFTTSSIIFCPSASIYLEGKTGNPTGNITFRIETNDSNEPSGTLAHANATATAAPSQPAWNKASFTPFELPAGTYWLVVYVPDQDPNAYWHLTRDVNGIGQGTWSEDHASSWEAQAPNTYMIYFRVYKIPLQCYSESGIKEQGSYSLKGIAKQTCSLNEYLERTIGSPIDLSGIDIIKFDIYASRTGGNIKIGIHDSGGTTSEKTHTQAGAGAWEPVTWDISGVSDANKDDIDSIIITIVNADADNTFYIDNLRTAVIYTITASAGSYSLSGQAMTPLASRFLSIGAGSYALSGQTAGTFYNRFLSIGTGSYTLTGQDIVLSEEFKLLLYSKILDSIIKESAIKRNITLTSSRRD